MNLSKLTPPGTDIRKELRNAGLIAFIAIFCWSLKFLFSYFSALNDLYVYEKGIRDLIKGAQMKSFSYCMRHAFLGFWYYVVFCIGMAAGYYNSFYRETRSIYVMKRLRDARELHIRCLSLPVMLLVAGIWLVAVLTTVYALIYRLATPAQCLPGNIGLDFWGSLL